MAGIPLFPKAIPFLFFIALFQVSFATSKRTGLSMRLIRTDSLYPGNFTGAERIKRLIQLSEARAHYLDSDLSPNKSADLDNVHLPIGRVPETYLYVVEIKIGSQLHPVKLLMDTGSGLIWTQCKPCVKCFRQKVPIYDSRASTSYHKLPCTHELCQGDNRRYRCYHNKCLYNIRYGVDSRSNSPRTRGIASFESFQFPVDNVQTRIIEDMIFGCSFDNQNFDFSNGQVSGILGLSLAPDALASQLARKGIILNRFSYCLVPFDDELVRPSVLRFGDDIPQPVGNLQTTEFLVNAGHYHYHMELLDISVGWHRLGFQLQPDIFRVRQDGTGGCLIDSGFLISTIDQNTTGRNAYKEVMAVFKAYYDSRNFQRMGKVIESLNLCYRSKPGFQDYLTMTLHFNGADYHIDGKYMHYFSEEGYFCVALNPSSKTILGSWQQQNMRIIYNMNVGGLQWVTETCANANNLSFSVSLFLHLILPEGLNSVPAIRDEKWCYKCGLKFLEPPPSKSSGLSMRLNPRGPKQSPLCPGNLIQIKEINFFSFLISLTHTFGDDIII
ncbi:aspartic proteinase nepenthesin-2-like [Durio zibethinus]|uniref:Aspartic proteinase nepenthesin-2-like n=1 Tax=Durio zibethinus TaxID=66656 RepID=A0A6P5WQ93_DURZI|nr:aspartic proteinase nepenthesin-2-like [Durio zibethinus]